MRWLTEDAVLVCDHGGKVDIAATQGFVRIEGRRALIEPNPEGRGISGCPNANPTIGIRPCLHTLKVQQGYSEFVRIAKHRVCLDTIEGLTDGSPPGVVSYKVRSPGQALLEAST